MKNPNKIEKVKSERITFGVYYVLFTLVAIMYLYPLVTTFFNSLKSDVDLMKDPTGLPTEWWRINNYIKVFTEFKVQITTVEVNYFGMLWNSLWMTCLRLFVNLASSVLLAYPVAKFKFPGKNFLYAVVIFVNTIPIIGSGAANYKLLKALNMLDNPTLIWISWCGGFDYAFIIFYGTFKGISDSYIESASLDGAGNLTIMFKIMLPQALPSIVALAITQAIPMWNDYSTSMIRMPKYPNLGYGIYKFEPGPYNSYDTAVYYCAVIISMLPPMILYAANQKFILSSLSIGGLKG